MQSVGVRKSASLQRLPVAQHAVPGLSCRTKYSGKFSKNLEQEKNVLPPPVVPTKMDAFLHARPFESIPGPTSLPQSIPFAGTRLLYYPFTDFKMDNMGDMLTKMQATYGPILRVKLGAEWTVMIENLNDIEHVVRSSEEAHDRGITKPPVKTFKAPLDSLTKRSEDQDLAWLNGREMSNKMRSAVSYILNSNATVTQYLEGQEAIAVDFANELEHLQDSPQEVQNLCYRYAFESVGMACFSKRLGMLSEHYFSDGEKQKLLESYRTLVRSLGENLTGTRVLHLIFDVPFVKRFREALHTVKTWERKMMREATMSAIREKGVSTLEPAERSLLVSLMDDKTLTEQEIAYTILNLMTSGVEVIGCAMQTLLFCLATNSEKQEKLYTELEKILGPEFKVTPNNMETLDYLKASVKESMRLHFPVAAGGRVVLSSNIVLSNYLIPAGTVILVNSRRCAKNPIWFDHPQYFLPERWIGDAAQNIPTLACLPFGFGFNHCPIRTFALQEVYAATIKILQKFRVDLPADFQNGHMETVYTPFRRPKEPLPFFFTVRSPTSKSSPIKTK